MRISFFTLILIALILNEGKAQNQYWEQVTSNWRIFTGGAFDYSENFEMCIYTGVLREDSGNRFIAGFDGSEWISIVDSANLGFNTFVDFDEGILVGGPMPLFGTESISHIAYFDGLQWSYPYSFNNSITKFKWVNDTLYTLGHFTEIDGVPAHNIARLVGGSWEGVLQPSDDLSWAMFADIAYFEGEYYVGGNFESVSGPDDFAILRDGMLHEVGEGLTGSWTTVGSLEVYQDNLYIFGNIPEIQGNVGDHILRWDGVNYHALAGPFLDANGNQSAAGAGGRLMKVNGDYLYICGTFKYIEGVEMNFLARWDGSQWCGLHTSHFIDWMPDFAFLNDELIVVTPDQSPEDTSNYEQFFRYIAGDEVSECSLPLSVSGSRQMVDVSLYPNPYFGSYAHGISVNSSHEFNEIAIYDMSGRLVFQESIVPTTQYVLSLSRGDFGAGMYVVHLMGKAHRASRKLVGLD